MSSIQDIISKIGSTADIALDTTNTGLTKAEEAIYSYMTGELTSAIRPVVTALGDELTLLSSMTVASTVSAFMPLGVTKMAADLINTIVATTSAPNIEGVPIRATRETMSRAVDVAETVVIVQSNSNKEVLQDNAVPHPREWVIEGYLASISAALDAYFSLKPTILMQAWYLDVLAKSRLPVWYKTHDNLFYQVLISSFSYTYESNIQNAIGVNLTLKEYIPLKAITTATGPDLGGSTLLESFGIYSSLNRLGI